MTKRTTEDRMQKWFQKHPGATARLAAKNLGFPMDRVLKYLENRSTDVRLSNEVYEEKTFSKVFGKPITEFRQAYDKDYIVPQAIRQGLKALGKGWEYEVEFARHIGVRMADLANYRELFTEHIVLLNHASKRVWAGKADLAKQLREMI